MQLARHQTKLGHLWQCVTNECPGIARFEHYGVEGTISVENELILGTKVPSDGANAGVGGSSDPITISSRFPHDSASPAHDLQDLA